MTTAQVVFLIALAIGMPPGAGAQDTAAVEQSAARVEQHDAMVVLGSDTVFVVRVRIGSFSPAERATAIQRRIQQLAHDPFFDADSLQQIENDGASDIVFGDRVLLSVTEADAAAAGLPRSALAAATLLELRQSLQRQSWSTRLRTIAFGAGFTVLTVLIILVIFRIVRRVFRRVNAMVRAGRSTWIRPLRIQNQELLSAQQTATILLGLLKALRLIVLVVLVYLALPAVLSFFPWTRVYADQLFGYFLAPFGQIWSAILHYLPNLFSMAAIGALTWLVLKLIRVIFDGIAGGNIAVPGFYAEWADPTYKLVRVLVLAFTLIMIWPYLPASDSPAFKGVGVMLGLLLSIGSASAIGNLVGGVVLTYMRPFKIGDRVQIADTAGDIIERTLLVTRIRTIKNVEITVPNSMVLSNHIVNYSAAATDAGLILHTTVTIGYDAPWRRVHELLVGAAAATPDLLQVPPPFVLQTSLDDFYVSYQLNAHTNQPGRMAAIYSELHSNIQDQFNGAGIEIMSPHFRAQRDGNASAVPAGALPKDYRAPAFRLETVHRDGT